MAKRRTMNDSINDIVISQIDSMPQIEVVTITKVYSDNKFVDCKLESDEILECIPIIANHLAVNNTGLLLPVKNGDFYVISRWYEYGIIRFN